MESAPIRMKNKMGGNAPESTTLAQLFSELLNKSVRFPQAKGNFAQMGDGAVATLRRILGLIRELAPEVTWTKIPSHDPAFRSFTTYLNVPGQPNVRIQVSILDASTSKRLPSIGRIPAGSPVSFVSTYEILIHTAHYADPIMVRTMFRFDDTEPSGRVSDMSLDRITAHTLRNVAWSVLSAVSKQSA